LDIVSQLVGVEPGSHVLDAQGAVLIHERGEKGVIDVADSELLGVDPVLAGDGPDLVRRPGEESPAEEIGPVSLGIVCEDLWRVTLGVDGDGDEKTLEAKTAPRLSWRPAILAVRRGQASAQDV